MGQDPVVEIQHAALAFVLFREGYVVADVDVNAIVVNRVNDFPVICFLFSGAVVIRLLQTAIRNCDETLRRRHAGPHSAIGFVSTVVLVGPPDTGADTLTGGDDEVLAQIFAAPGDAADPWWVPAYHGN